MRDFGAKNMKLHGFTRLLQVLVMAQIAFVLPCLASEDSPVIMGTKNEIPAMTANLLLVDKNFNQSVPCSELRS